MKKIVLVCLGVLATLVISVVVFLNSSLSPIEKAREMAVQLVSQEQLITQVDDFYWYTGEKETYALVGKKDNQERVYIVIDVANVTGVVYADNEIVDRQVIEQKVKDKYSGVILKKTTLGIEGSQVVWEVMYTHNHKLSYSMFDAKTGELVREIKTAMNE